MGLSCMDPIIRGFFFFPINTVQYNLRAEPVDVEPQIYRMDYKWVFSDIPNLCVVKGSNVYQGKQYQADSQPSIQEHYFYPLGCSNSKNRYNTIRTIRNQWREITR